MRARPNNPSTRYYTAIRVGLAAWAAFSGLNAQAATLEDVKAAFGNTVLATYPDGRHQRIWLKEDGAYEAIGRRGKPSVGTWSMKGEKVCLKQIKPFRAPISYCTAFPANGGVGATWTGKDISGTPIKLTLLKGVQRPTAGAGT
ncbi:hypothetical protein [Phenylobacterium sp.]|jgi:hypothetical protein|uniref:hypothetical protein n=1 Tax=Phenylobacterium sp. TaxID=1871053 RepID=UPI002F92F9DE